MMAGLAGGAGFNLIARFSFPGEYLLFLVTVAILSIMALPCLVLFLLVQRHDVRGFMTGVLRG